MLDDLIELALELIFEGAMESAHARRKPLYARLALAGILLVLFAGVTGLLVWAGTGHDRARASRLSRSASAHSWPRFDSRYRT